MRSSSYMVKFGYGLSRKMEERPVSHLFSLISFGKNDYPSLTISETGEGQSFFFSTDAESVPVFCLMG